MSALDTTAKQILDPVIGGGDDIAAMARALVLKAAELGLVLTIETVPAEPLAMGNYGLQVSLRERRQGLEVVARWVRKFDSVGGVR